jgi:hypothetical protein
MTQPRPTTIRLSMADGRVEELACSGQPWARLGESCDAMDPVTIFAVDANGKLIRAAKVADIAEGIDLDDDGNPSACSSAGSSAGSSAIEVATAAKLERDDSRAMLAVLDKFGTLLANAYHHATTVAFDEMKQITQIFATATTQMQKELVSARLETRRYERDILDDALEKAEASGDGDAMRQFIGAYFSGQAERLAQQATAAVTPTAKPNGKPPTGEA